MIKISEEIKKKFGRRLLTNEKLANYSWFNLGGPAEFFFKPENINDLIDFLKEVRPNKITLIGSGSNTLIRDGGVKGLTIKLGSSFSYVKLLDNHIVEAGAATQDKRIADFALNNSLAGLEFLSCIPGSIGGGIRMNSGCYGEDISKILHSVKAINIDGKEIELAANDIKFFYRGTDLKDDLIITSVRLIGKTSSKEDIKNKQEKLINQKKISQPSQVKTCGSTFKNTEKKKAWELIKESGCQNYKVGGVWSKNCL